LLRRCGNDKEHKRHLNAKEKNTVPLTIMFFFLDKKELKNQDRLKVFSAEASTGEALPIFITPFGL
jgi:hypothetical protein